MAVTSVTVTAVTRSCLSVGKGGHAGTSEPPSRKLPRTERSLPLNGRALYPYSPQTLPAGALPSEVPQRPPHTTLRDGLHHGTPDKDVEVLLVDDFEGRRIGKVWQRTRAERTKCGLITDPETGNRCLRLKTADLAGSRAVTASAGDTRWGDYQVRLRFRLKQGSNAFFRFRCGTAAGRLQLRPGRSPQTPDSLLVKLDASEVTVASASDGVLGSWKGGGVGAGEERFASTSWYHLDVKLRGRRLYFAIQQQSRGDEEDADSKRGTPPAPVSPEAPKIPAIRLSGLTRLRSGGLSLGIYRGELWIDDVWVREL
ncbi:MAG: hypothetical protein HY318_06000 [Armatimonadetes bacterium]|nr:hypothetical protein [Armatimonadota bacterium]